MIKLQVIATYYIKKDFLKSSIVEEKKYYTIEEAIEDFKTKDPKYYINKKDISIIESIKLIYKIELGYKVYTKTIDPITYQIESNYKED